MVTKKLRWYCCLKCIGRFWQVDVTVLHFYAAFFFIRGITRLHQPPDTPNNICTRARLQKRDVLGKNCLMCICDDIIQNQIGVICYLKNIRSLMLVVDIRTFKLVTLPSFSFSYRTTYLCPATGVISHQQCTLYPSDN